MVQSFSGTGYVLCFYGAVLLWYFHSTGVCVRLILDDQMISVFSYLKLVIVFLICLSLYDKR